MRSIRHVIHGGGSLALPQSNWFRQGDVLYNFATYDVLSEELLGVRIIHVGEHFRPVRATEAAFAKYEEMQNGWMLHDVNIFTFSPYGTILAHRKQDTLLSYFPLELKHLREDRRRGIEMGVGELYTLISRGKASGLNVTAYEVDMHVKIAFYFAAFIVALLGLKFGFRSERTMETARSIAVALGVGVSYWLILNLGIALGKRETLSPFFAAWLANIIIFSIVLRELWKTRKA
jgi:lipopolysaccharide export LptBFGC system permease protein LptF